MAQGEDIILNFKVNTEDARKSTEQLAESIEKVKKEQEKLTQELNDGTKTLEEYNKETQKNTKSIKTGEAVLKQLTIAVEDQVESIDSLRESNKKLTQERNKVDISTAEGQKRLKELNIELDKNNKTIQQNVSNLEKQKINIGNYSSALQGISPGLSGFINGIKGATETSKVFISTPLGAVLAAIGLAFASVTAYLKGSEEGQRKLNTIIQTGSALFERFMDIIENIGEYLLNAFTNPKQVILDFLQLLQNQVVNRIKSFAVIIEGIANLDFKKVSNGTIQLATGIENVIDKTQSLAKNISSTVELGIQQGQKLAALQEKIRKAENAYLVESAKVTTEVAKLKEQAVIQEGDLKIKTFEKAIALEKGLADQAIALAQKKLDLAKLEVEVKGNEGDNVKAVAEAEAALIQARAQGAEDTLRLQKQLQSEREKEINTIEKLGEKFEDAQDKMEQEMADYFAKLDDEANKTIDTQYKIGLQQLDTDRQIKEQLLKQDEAYRLQQEEDQKKWQEKQKADDIALYNFKIQTYSQLFNELNNLAAEGTIASKIAALGQIAIDTAVAISALTKNSEANPANAVTFGGAGTIQFATGLIRILGNISQAKNIITGSGFAEGGYTGPGGKYEPAGIVHKGEVVFNQSDVSALGGPMAVNAMRPTFRGYADGGIVTSAMTGPIDRQFSMANAFKNMPPIVASWKEATELNTRIQFKETLTTV